MFHNDLLKIGLDTGNVNQCSNSPIWYGHRVQSYHYIKNPSNLLVIVGPATNNLFAMLSYCASISLTSPFNCACILRIRFIIYFFWYLQEKTRQLN